MKTPWTSNRHPCFQTLRERVGFGRTGHKQVLSHPDLFWSLLYIGPHVILETLVLHFHSQSSESDIPVWGLPPEASGDTKRLSLPLYVDFSLNLRKPLKWLLITHSSSSSSLFLNRFSYLVPIRGPYNQGLEVPFYQFSSVQSLSRVRFFATPWTAARLSSLSFTISWSLLKFMSVETVMAIQPLHSLFPPSPSAFNPFQHQGLF